MSITAAAIKAAKPGAILWDDRVKGLHVRVGSTGATFTLFYRTKSGRQRRPKIGSVDVVPLTRARDIAREMLLEVATGKDPAGQINALRDSPTMKDLCTRYMAKHARPNKKPRSAEYDQWLCDHVILPRWGARKCAEVESSDVFDLREEMAGQKVQFNRARSLLSKMFNLAEVPWNLRPKGSNPCEGVPRYPEKPRRRYMTAPEALAIARGLLSHETAEPAGVAFIRLLILTGARKSEIAAARWEWVEALPNGTGMLRLPDAKTGARDIRLSRAAMDVIATLPRTSGTVTGIQSPRKLWTAIRSKAGCPDLRLHDLRHSFASVALSIGYNLNQIGELLGHASAQTTKRYAHLLEDSHTEATAQIAAAIALRMTAASGSGGAG